VTSLSTGESYTYDANGNMITRVEGGQTYNQVFDAENRLISVTVNSQTTQFVYDGDGNLVKKVNPDGSRTIYVGGIYEVDKNSGGTVTKTTVYYPVGGAMRVNGTLYYVLKDHLGSASVVTDSAGNTVGEARYYPFGETRLTTGTINTDKLFTGQREMTGLGIYHYGARFYSPKLGRFLSADSMVPNMANPQAFNRYSYVYNNPLRYTDPSGHFICSNDRNSDDYCPGRTSIIGSNGSSGSSTTTSPYPSTPPQLPPPCTRNCGDPGPRDDGDDQSFLSEVAYLADNVGAIASDIEAVVVDTIGAIVITEGCLLGVTCLPALGYAVAIDIGVSTFSTLGLIENLAGGVALSSTALEDYFVNGTSYFRFNDSGGYDIGIGRDTVVSSVNFLAGLVPEANYDAWISHQQLEYDDRRRSGEISAITLIEFSIPPPPNIWGEGWPNTIP
jgi:RHS repeat-associated protein